MKRMTAKQKQQLLGLLDWFFSSLEEDTVAKGARVSDAKDSSASNGYQVEDLTGDSEAPPTAEQHAAQMRAMPRQHPDSSARGVDVPGFVPSAVANGSAVIPSGLKTDTGQVKRI